MPKPLTAKGASRFSPGAQIVAGISLGLPLLGLWYCFKWHHSIQFDDPRLNLAAHAGLVVFPLIWVGLMNYQPVVYESSDADIVLDRSSYISRLPVNWWMMLIMWATPVFALIAAGQALTAHYLPHPESLSTSPGKAVLIMVVVFCLGAFYATILLSRSEPATRISKEGLRTGILRFYEWKDIHHLSQHGCLYAIFHQTNPALPATSFRVRGRESQTILERHLSEHHIRIFNESEPAYQLTKVAVVLGFAANLAFGFWLRTHTSLPLAADILVSFGLGIAMTVALEKYRGVANFGKLRPVLKLTDEGASGNSQTPLS